MNLILGSQSPRRRELMAGLDIPFTAKVLRTLRENGVEISSNLRMEDFVEKILQYAKTMGAGMQSLAREEKENA